MTTRTILARAAALSGLLAIPARAQDTVWTMVIPHGFPGYVYSWRLKPDGGYSENGRDAHTGRAIEPTLSGHWSLNGRHMVLRQDGIDYVFVGDTTGDEYLGIVYLDGRRFARFCAIKGEAPPQNCADISV